MNILYFCNVNQQSKAAVGVFKKILAQRKVLFENQFNVYLSCYKDVNTYVVLSPTDKVIIEVDVTGLKGNARTKKIIKKLTDFLEKNKIDVLYSRYETYSLQLSSFYKLLHEKNIQVLLEVPTYPITQRWTTIKTSLKNRKIKIGLQQLYNATINSLGIRKFYKGVDYIITNNGYDQIWKVSTIKISNGVDVSSIPVHHRNTESINEIHLLGVANLARWHGYDRIIEGMNDYYKSEHEKKVFFHIAGAGLELKNLQTLVSKYELKDYVYFYGTVVGDELDKLFEKADLGVSILGAHRSHMKTCDSLKSKEYCARRLPFITGQIERMYWNQPFAFCIEDNDTAVKISDIIDFYESYKNIANIDEYMYNFATERCDWGNTFSNVVEYLRGLKCYGSTT